MNIHLGRIGNDLFARYEIGLKIYLEKYEIVPTFLPAVPQKEGNLVRISLADSCAGGFNKWCAAHDSGGQAVDHVVTTPPERPNRPWLVPGAGTL